jgi:hypothetical protein
MELFITKLTLFYESKKPDQESPKFSNVWVLENDQWKLETLSYGHEADELENKETSIFEGFGNRK